VCKFGYVLYNQSSCELYCPLDTDYIYTQLDPANENQIECVNACKTGYYYQQSNLRPFACTNEDDIVAEAYCDPAKNYTRKWEGLTQTQCYEYCPNDTFVYENNHTCLDACPSESFAYNNVCMSECPSGTYVLNASDPINEMGKDLRFCFDKCPDEFYTEDN